MPLRTPAASSGDKTAAPPCGSPTRVVVLRCQAASVGRSWRPSHSETDLLQRLTPRVAGVEVVPAGDVVLALDPAQVDLTALAQRREVDQPPVQVAENDAAVGELCSAGAELDKRLTHLPAAAATAVPARGADQGLACLGVGEPVARVPQRNEPLPHPRQLRPRLLERVMAVVAHQAAQYIRPTGRRRAAPRLRRA